MVKELLANGHVVLCCGRANKSIDTCSNYSAVDVTDIDTLKMLNMNVDCIFIYSARTGTANGFDEYDEFIKVNEIGLLNVIQQYRTQGSNARLIFPSTRLVYKGKESVELKEGSEKEAKTIYALNKISCEIYLDMYAQNFDLPYTIFRICVPYGNEFDGSYSYGTIGFMLDRALAGKDISLFGDGVLKRTLSHAADISRNILMSLDSEDTVNEIFNIGGETLSLKQIAELIATKYNVRVISTDWPEQAHRLESGDTIFCSKKLDSLIFYSRENSFEKWLSSF
jgi:UDP-glucose 4-epimerase